MLSNINDLLWLKALVERERLKRLFVLSQGSVCGALLLLSLCQHCFCSCCWSSSLSFPSVDVWFHCHEHFLLIKHSSWGSCWISVIHLAFEGLIDSALFKALFWSFLCIDICGDNSWAPVLGDWISPWYCTHTEGGFWTSYFSVFSVWFLSLFLEMLQSRAEEMSVAEVMCHI